MTDTARPSPSTPSLTPAEDAARAQMERIFAAHATEKEKPGRAGCSARLCEALQRAQVAAIAAEIDLDTPTYVVTDALARCYGLLIAQAAEWAASEKRHEPTLAEMMGHIAISVALERITRNGDLGRAGTVRLPETGRA